MAIAHMLALATPGVKTVGSGFVVGLGFVGATGERRLGGAEHATRIPVIRAMTTNFMLCVMRWYQSVGCRFKGNRNEQSREAVNQAPDAVELIAFALDTPSARVIIGVCWRQSAPWWGCGPRWAGQSALWLGEAVAGCRVGPGGQYRAFC